MSKSAFNIHCPQTQLKTLVKQIIIYLPHEIFDAVIMAEEIDDMHVIAIHLYYHMSKSSITAKLISIKIQHSGYMVRTNSLLEKKCQVQQYSTIIHMYILPAKLSIYYSRYP